MDKIDIVYLWVNGSDKNTPQMLRANADFLKHRFPTKSEFEK